MDLEQVQRLAQAFAQGVAFARGFTEMAQDAKDGEEEGHWVTIGGERGADGEKHGGRPVFISGSGVIKKGLSKSAQGKTLGQVFGKGGEFSSEGEKSKGETARKAGKRAATKRAEAEKARKDATSRAKEFRQETKRIVVNDLDPSVTKLKKALDANVPARVHDDLVDMHRLADQIGVMASKLSSLNSRYAENSKEPSAFVVSSHGHTATVTAEAVANLARRSAALAHDFDKPIEERTYGDARAASEIKDNLSKVRGLHQDLLDHIRRIQEPEKREEPQEDPLYAARGKMINGPAGNKKSKNKPEESAMNALKGPSLRDRWDEYQETHGKPLNASAVYDEYSSIEKEIKAAEAKNEYSKAELKKKIDDNAKSIRDAVNKIGYDGKDRYPLYEDVRRARVGDLKGQASDMAREVARELEQEAYNFNSWKGTDLNRLNAISQRATAAVITGLEGVAHYADAKNSEQAQAQFDDLKKVAGQALQAVKDAGTIGWIDSHTDDRSHGDNVIKDSIKSIKLPTLRENLKDSGLRASQKEKMINMHAEIEQSWNKARAKGSVVNQAIKTQLAKGTLPGERASNYASTVDLDLRRIDNLTNSIAKTLALSSKPGSTINPHELVSIEGKHAEIKELTRDLDRINKQIRGR